jgi:hypothetical protein
VRELEEMMADVHGSSRKLMVENADLKVGIAFESV